MNDLYVTASKKKTHRDKEGRASTNPSAEEGASGVKEGPLGKEHLPWISGPPSDIFSSQRLAPQCGQS